MAFKPALGELYKKHPVCTKIRLFEIKNRFFFLGGDTDAPQWRGDTPSPSPTPTPLTTKLGPIDFALHLSISRRQNSMMVWSLCDCSRIPHLRSIIYNITQLKHEIVTSDMLLLPYPVLLSLALVNGLRILGAGCVLAFATSEKYC